MIVLDERADGDAIGNPKLIFLAGTHMTPKCLKAVEQKVRNGAVCVAMSWLMPEVQPLSRRDGLGKWIVVDDLECAVVKEETEKFLGERNCWMQRFGNYEVRLYNEIGDGVTLTHEMRKIATSKNNKGGFCV